MRLAIALQAALLRLAPRAFRARFGAELLDSAERALADARRSSGALGELRVALRHTADVALSVLRLNLEAPAMRKLLVLLPFALLASAGIGWMDAHIEPVQPAAGMLLVATGVLCFLDPRRAWLWWLVLGLSIPTAYVVQRLSGASMEIYQGSPFVGTFIALIPAGIGACIGIGARRLLRTDAAPPAAPR